MTMKLDYLPDGSPDCPLIRIYGDDPASTQQLHAAMVRLAGGHHEPVLVHRLRDVQSVDQCGLVLFADAAHEGIHQNSSTEFSWVLTGARWSTVAALVEPFTSPAGGQDHRWLCGPRASPGLNVSRIAVLLSSSPDGNW